MGKKLRRYCWRTGAVYELAEDEVCPECGSLGGIHRPVPVQTECGAFAPITDSSGGPCFLPIGHEGPHVPPPELVNFFEDKGKKVLIGDEDNDE